MANWVTCCTLSLWQTFWRVWKLPCLDGPCYHWTTVHVHGLGKTMFCPPWYFATDTTIATPRTVPPSPVARNCIMGHGFFESCKGAITLWGVDIKTPLGIAGGDKLLGGPPWFLLVARYACRCSWLSPVLLSLPMGTKPLTPLKERATLNGQRWCTIPRMEHQHSGSISMGKR